jgi:hypothetical protein
VKRSKRKMKNVGNVPDNAIASKWTVYVLTVYLTAERRAAMVNR